MRNILLCQLQHLLSSLLTPTTATPTAQVNVYCLEKLFNILVRIQPLYRDKTNIHIQIGAAEQEEERGFQVDMSSERFDLLASLMVQVAINKLHIFESYQLANVVTTMSLLGFTFSNNTPDQHATTSTTATSKHNNNKLSFPIPQTAVNTTSKHMSLSVSRSHSSSHSSRVLTALQKERLLAILSRVLPSLKVDDAITLLCALCRLNIHNNTHSNNNYNNNMAHDAQHIFKTSYSSISSITSLSDSSLNINTTTSSTNTNTIKRSEPLLSSLFRYIKRNIGWFREQDISMLLFISGT